MSGADPDMVRLAAAGLAAAAGQAPGIVKVRLAGEPADVEMLAPCWPTTPDPVSTSSTGPRRTRTAGIPACAST